MDTTDVTPTATGSPSRAGSSPDDGAPRTTGRRRTLATVGWSLHWLLRMALLVIVGMYGWAKVFLGQMGRADVGDALVRYGEMSPMGLLWRMMGFSPLVQVLAGLVEVLAVALLIWRRTAVLGGLAVATSMGVVFVLNLGYDVPVKQQALLYTIGGLLVAAPGVPRVLRFVAGRSTGPAVVPTAVPWPRVARVTRVVGPLLGVAVLAVGGWATGARLSATTTGGNLPGVYRVVADTRPPAPTLAGDDRWQQVALGRYATDSGARFTVRKANGELLPGMYRQVDDRTLEVTLPAPLAGDAPISRREGTRTESLTVDRETDGRIHLVGGGQDVWLESDAEGRFLFDRDFSWESRRPVNR